MSADQGGPRRKVPKISDVKIRADKLINWYRDFKPTNHVLSLSPEDFAAFESAAGTNGILLVDSGLRYRDFEIRRVPA